MILQDGSQNDQYGLELVLDLYDCDKEKISSVQNIRDFVIKLCDEVVEMKRYGEPLIPHFGHENPITSGYSLVQLIETSAVTAHFSEYKRSIYLNIFSCKWFDANRAARFSKIWFGARRIKRKLVQRV